MSTQKPTLATLMKRHGVTLEDLADASKLSSLFVWSMREGYTMERTEAMQILIGLNWLCQTAYSLEDFSVPLRE